MHPRTEKGPNFFVIGLAAAVLVGLIVLSRRLPALLAALEGGG